jgi:hypothetical protein
MQSVWHKYIKRADSRDGALRENRNLMRGVGHACTNSVVLSTTKRSMSSNFVVASVYKRLSVVSSELNNPQRRKNRSTATRMWGSIRSSERQSVRVSNYGKRNVQWSAREKRAAESGNRKFTVRQNCAETARDAQRQRIDNSAEVLKFWGQTDSSMESSRIWLQTCRSWRQCRILNRDWLTIDKQ